MSPRCAAVRRGLFLSGAGMRRKGEWRVGNGAADGGAAWGAQDRRLPLSGRVGVMLRFGRKGFTKASSKE